MQKMQNAVECLINIRKSISADIGMATLTKDKVINQIDSVITMIEDKSVS